MYNKEMNREILENARKVSGQYAMLVDSYKELHEIIDSGKSNNVKIKEVEVLIKVTDRIILKLGEKQ